MRLIDADEALRLFHRMRLPVSVTILGEVSTVDPVKHGHWILENEHPERGYKTVTRCSSCNAFSIMQGWNLFDYCSFCGAKMDEEATNEQTD